MNVDVWEQRVMLTGTLDDAGVRSEVESLTKQDSRIKVIHNHIQVVTKAEKEARRKQKEEGGDKKIRGRLNGCFDHSCNRWS